MSSISTGTLKLVDTVTTAEHGDTRTCSGTMQFGEDHTGIGLPIEYEVFETDDGEIRYRWNDAEFGKSFVAASVLQTLANATKAVTPATRLPSQLQRDRAREYRPRQSLGLVNGNVGLKPALSPADKWKSSVRALIRERASAHTNMPHGTQTFTFRVGPDGEISDVHARGADQDSSMTKATARFLEEMDRVPKPPDYEAYNFSLTLTF